MMASTCIVQISCLSDFTLNSPSADPLMGRRVTLIDLLRSGAATQTSCVPLDSLTKKKVRSSETSTSETKQSIRQSYLCCLHTLIDAKLLWSKVTIINNNYRKKCFENVIVLAWYIMRQRCQFEKQF